MVELSRILDRVAATPSFARKLKGPSGVFKIVADGAKHRVRYKRFDSGHIEFSLDVPESERVYPIGMGRAA